MSTNKSSGNNSSGFVGVGIILILFAVMWAQTGGFQAAPVAVSNVHVAETTPTADDDIDRGFLPGAVWVDQAGPGIYGVVSSANGAADWNQLDGAGGSGGHTIRDEGTDRTARTGLNFAGAGVSCVDDAGDDETECTISGGGSGIETQEGDVQVTAAATVLDFGPGFDLTDSPEGETNVVLDLTEKQVDVTTEITGIVPIGNGGTGQVTATEDGLLMGNTSAFIVAVVPSCSTNNYDRLQFDNTADSWACDTDQIDISADTNLVAGTGATLTGDSISVDLGTSIDISAETNLSAGTGATLTGDVISVDLGTSIVSGEIVDGTISEADFAAVDAAADEECLTYESTIGDFEWQSCGGGSSVAEGRPATGTVNYSLPGAGFTGASTEANVANTLYYMPIMTRTTITLDRIAIQVSSSSVTTGSTARLGIYEATINWQPDALIVDAGTVAIDSTGIKALTIAETLVAGRYLLVYIADQSDVVYREMQAIAPFSGIAPTAFVAPIIELSIASQASAHPALPDPGTDWVSAAGSASIAFRYIVVVRVSSP